MQVTPQRWTDDRLDDLRGRVESGLDHGNAELRVFRAEMKAEFAAVRAEMKAEFAAVRAEMKAGFDKVDERFNKVDERFEAVDERFERIEARLTEKFDELHRTLVRTGASPIVALFLYGVFLD